jgi:hypothetical protein
MAYVHPKFAALEADIEVPSGRIRLTASRGSLTTISNMSPPPDDGSAVNCITVEAVLFGTPPRADTTPGNDRVVPVPELCCPRSAGSPPIDNTTISAALHFIEPLIKTLLGTN